MTNTTGGSAFPVLPTRDTDWNGVDAGMTLRDYFAAKAMASLMQVYWGTQDEYSSAQEMLQCQVETAYEYADAMLKQRDK